MTIRNLALTGLVIILSIAGTGVSVGDEKYYSGAACALQDGSYYSYVDRGSAGAYAVWDTYVVCPYVRDKTNSKKGAKKTSLYVYDADSTDSIYCCAEHANRYGTNSKTKCDQTSYYGTGRDRLNLTQKNSYEDGAYAITCYIPSGSSLYGYEVRER
jgi:hypothetical protein